MDEPLVLLWQRSGHLLDYKIIYSNVIQILQHGRNLVNLYLLYDITDDAIYFL